MSETLRAELLAFVAALCREGRDVFNDRGGVLVEGRGFFGLCELNYDEKSDGSLFPDYYPVDPDDLETQRALVDA